MSRAPHDTHPPGSTRGEEPLVTVAMVTYNSAAYVAAAVSSVLAQDFRDFELLVCDDASSDATVAIVRGFEDPRLRLVTRERNLGEYRNRNEALSLARGRYLVYIDGDDILYPHGLGVMVRALEDCPRAGFAACRPWSERFVYPVLLEPAQFYRCQLLGPNVAAINFAHLVFRTERLRECGGFDTRYRAGDTHIQYRVGARHPALLIGDGLAWWRRTPGQASESLLADGRLDAEAACYLGEMLAAPECPLTAEERAMARINVNGVFLRIVARYILRGRWIHAAALLRLSGLGPRDWPAVLRRSKRPYLAHVTAARPIHLRLEP